MSNEPGLEMLKIASEHYRQDLREIWARLGLYSVSQAFLFAAFVALVTQSRPPHFHDFLFELILGAIGALLGLVGFLVTLDSSEWVDRWERRVREIEGLAVTNDQYRCYSKLTPERTSTGILRHRIVLGAFLGPAGFTLLVPLVFFIGWLAMVLVVLLAGPQVT